MIYTVTFNPSLDYIASCKDFKLGETNRTCKEFIFPGGKGINVYIVLRNLGLETSALGFLAGFTGLFLELLVFFLVFRSTDLSLTFLLLIS